MSPAEAETLVDAHHGAMRRLARLVGRGPGGPDDAVRRAWTVALARPDDRPTGASMRGWLLGLVLDELAVPGPRADPPPLAPPADFEAPDGRWAGWWRDALSATPMPEQHGFERALGSVPAGLAAILLLRDVEGLDPGEIAVLTGHTAESQLVLLHYGRVSVRSALLEGVT